MAHSALIANSSTEKGGVNIAAQCLLLGGRHIPECHKGPGLLLVEGEGGELEKQETRTAPWPTRQLGWIMQEAIIRMPWMR
jgi:hypothetical protein